MCVCVDEFTRSKHMCAEWPCKGLIWPGRCLFGHFRAEAEHCPETGLCTVISGHCSASTFRWDFRARLWLSKALKSAERQVSSLEKASRENISKSPKVPKTWLSVQPYFSRGLKIGTILLKMRQKAVFSGLMAHHVANFRRQFAF